MKITPIDGDDIPGLEVDKDIEEGQRYVAELIERQNIDFMHNFAMEHMPEAFIPVHMLFIRMKINNCPVIAFIDSGAQTSILSESCAKRCNVLRMVDKRIRVRHMDRQSLLALVKAVRDIAPNIRFNVIKCAHLLTNGNCGGGHINRKNIFCIMFSKINNVDFNRHIFFTSYDVYLLEIIYEKRIIIQLKRENVRLKRQINRLKREDIRKQREIEALQKLIREQQAEIDELLKVNAAQKTILKIQTNIIAHLNETLYGSLTNRRPCQNGRKCSFEYYFDDSNEWWFFKLTCMI
uniref:Aspartic peptidase DDI1-type domain-containing protein n=1 Tax=Meloidogyne incognita TaxID=6306 RepID=A0A914NP53_MELIC